jgi:hypothetical protein
MCALCGVLGGSEHWTESASGAGLGSPATNATTRRGERMRRVQAANRVLSFYRLQLADWQGSTYVLSTATGKSELVDNLSHLWSVAEQLTSQPCDPLDPALLNWLESTT